MITEGPAGFTSRLVASPCCLPTMLQEELFPTYRKLGFRNYEAFSHWAACRHAWTGNPAADRAAAAAFGLQITSYHLPSIGKNIEEGLQAALAAARYASRLGDGVVVLFKADSREIFAKIGRRFLDALEAERLGVTPVLQNHKGTAISTLDDYREVLAAINDSRLRCILEVGHFQRVGVSWKQGWDLLGDRIALIHVNDIRNDQSVLYGTGEVDFPGLMKQIKTAGYDGRIVVELELPKRNEAPRETLEGLRSAIGFLSRCYQNA